MQESGGAAESNKKGCFPPTQGKTAGVRQFLSHGSTRIGPKPTSLRRITGPGRRRFAPRWKRRYAVLLILRAVAACAARSLQKRRGALYFSLNALGLCGYCRPFAEKCQESILLLGPGRFRGRRRLRTVPALRGFFLFFDSDMIYPPSLFINNPLCCRRVAMRAS